MDEADDVEVVDCIAGADPVDPVHFVRQAVCLP